MHYPSSRGLHYQKARGQGIHQGPRWGYIQVVPLVGTWEHHGAQALRGISMAWWLYLCWQTLKRSATKAA